MTNFSPKYLFMRFFKLLLLCLFVFPTVVNKLCAQEMVGDNLVCSEVLDFPGMTQNQLFTKSKEWLAYTYKNSLFTIQVDDAENGKLISKGVYKDFHIANYKSGFMPHTMALTMDHIITIRCKDNKVKISIETGEIRVNNNGYDWDYKFPMKEVNPITNFTYKYVAQTAVEKGLSGAYPSAVKIMLLSISDYKTYLGQEDEDF